MQHDSMRFVAFLSYPHRGIARAVAAQLQRDIESLTLPRLPDSQLGHRRRLGRVFRDETDLSSAPSLSEVLKSALAESEHLILLLTADTKASRWVGEEVRHFIELGRRDRIVPILLEGEAADAWPNALAGLAEPLAIDARPQAGESERARRRRVVGKVAAALLHVDHDVLVDRQRRQQIARLRVWAVVSSGLLMVLAGLVAFALVQRTQAMEAKANETVARGSAEGLATFLLDDLSEALEPLGRVHLLEPVARQTKDYFDRSKSVVTSADDRRRRFRALHAVANIEAQTGHIEQAVESYREAWRMALEALMAGPSIQRARSDFATAAHSLTQAILSLGDVAGAVAVLDDATRWLGNEAWQHSDVQVARETITLMEDRAECAARDPALGDRASLAAAAVAQRRALASADTATSEDQFRLASALQMWARARRDVGDHDAALRALQEALGLFSMLARSDHESGVWSREWAAAEMDMATLSQLAGDQEAGLGHVDQALTVLEPLYRADEMNRPLLRDTRVARSIRAEILQTLGRLSDALAERKAAVSLASKLAALDPANAYWRQDQLRAMCDALDCAFLVGDTAGISEFKKQLSVGDAIQMSLGTNRDAILTAVKILNTCAKIALLDGDKEEWRRIVVAAADGCKHGLTVAPLDIELRCGFANFTRLQMEPPGCTPERALQMVGEMEVMLFGDSDPMGVDRRLQSEYLACMRQFGNYSLVIPEDDSPDTERRIFLAERRAFESRKRPVLERADAFSRLLAASAPLDSDTARESAQATLSLADCCAALNDPLAESLAADAEARLVNLLANSGDDVRLRGSLGTALIIRANHWVGVSGMPGTSRVEGLAALRTALEIATRAMSVDPNVRSARNLIIRAAPKDVGTTDLRHEPLDVQLEMARIAVQAKAARAETAVFERYLAERSVLPDAGSWIDAVTAAARSARKLGSPESAALLATWLPQLVDAAKREADSIAGRGDVPLATSALADLRSRLASLCAELGKIAPKPAEVILALSSI
ncbi:MAG: toll/interleukin-1 receptor domain-containing protein [Planctomycetes bacterium]|nr:toll/interleukin-1 receptor domain-containing protein [Planctomycetota bacterium]